MSDHVNAGPSVPAGPPHPYCVEHDQPLDWCRPPHPDVLLPVPAGQHAPPAEAITAAMAALATHRWKTMGVASVECECGVIISGQKDLTEFPADEAFRRHLAQALLEAAWPFADLLEGGTPQHAADRETAEAFRAWLRGTP